jgi:N-acetylglucosamine-6-sulfatase
MILHKAVIRRSLGLATGVASGLLLAQIAVADAGAHQTDGARDLAAPNVVLLMTDDQAISQMRPAVMPNVAKYLARRGTRFRHAYLTTPLCCPSRATLLTGQYGHNNGVLTNAYRPLREKRNVLPVWLRRAGYVTAHIGKFLNAYHADQRPLQPAPGWKQWYTLVFPDESRYYDYDLSANGRRVHHDERPRDYSSRVFDRIALRLIDRYVPHRRPLYLQLDEVAPHVQRGSSVPAAGCNPIPDRRDAGLFTDAPLPHPPSFNEADVSDKPSFIRRLPPLSEGTLAHMRRNYRCGLAALQEVDRSFGRIYDRIKRLGELDRTVFIFDSDNGMLYGEHRIPVGKVDAYEEAASTPLLMRVPARYLHGRRAVSTVAEPVANIDLAPTILRLAGAEPCASGCRVMDGRSLLGLIAGRTPRWAPDRPLGLELNMGPGIDSQAVCQYAGVRAFNQVLVHQLQAQDPETGECMPDDEVERYDLDVDPFELHNLCSGASPDGCPSDPVGERLQALLARISRCSGVRGRDPRPPSGYYCG